MGTPKVTPISEIRHAWGFLVWDPSDGIVTRQQITLATGSYETLFGGEDYDYAGLVLARLSGGVATPGANTGNGTFGNIDQLPGAPDGAYVATCIQATSGTGAASYEANEGNVGTGTIGTITVGAAAFLGEYEVRLTATGATAPFDVFSPSGALVGSGVVGSAFNAGGLGFTLANAGTMTKGDSYTIKVTDDGTAQFSLTDPLGNALPVVTVGVPYSHELAFTLAQGATKFVVGDTFTIACAAASALYAPYDPTQTNGLQYAAAILGSYRKDVTTANQAAAALVRGPARVNAAELQWGPNVTTTAQQTAALAQLSALGIQSTPGSTPASFV